jgi:hypothetical protein
MVDAGGEARQTYQTERAAIHQNRRPLQHGTPIGIRTPNLLIRSQVLYPIELWVHQFSSMRR